MADFLARLNDAWAKRDPVLTLALVPLVSSFLNVSNVVRVLGFRGFHFGLTFRFPTAVADVWTFVSVPNDGVMTVTGSFAFLLVAITIEAALAAGYVGSLHEADTSGAYDFVENVRQHALPMLGYVLLATLLGLVTAGAGLAGGPGGALVLVIVLLPVYFVLAYLFYATPYLIVIRDAGLEEALRGSYAHAVEGGEYLSFGLQYLGAVALLSVVGTLVVVNLGAIGIVVGSVAAAPLALALNLATVDFLADLDGATVGDRSDAV